MKLFFIYCAFTIKLHEKKNDLNETEYEVISRDGYK